MTDQGLKQVYRWWMAIGTLGCAMLPCVLLIGSTGCSSNASLLQGNDRRGSIAHVQCGDVTLRVDAVAVPSTAGVHYRPSMSYQQDGGDWRSLGRIDNDFPERIHDLSRLHMVQFIPTADLAHDVAYPWRIQRSWNVHIKPTDFTYAEYQKIARCLQEHHTLLAHRIRTQFQEGIPDHHGAYLRAVFYLDIDPRMEPSVYPYQLTCTADGVTKMIINDDLDVIVWRVQGGGSFTAAHVQRKASTTGGPDQFQLLDTTWEQATVPLRQEYQQLLLDCRNRDGQTVFDLYGIEPVLREESYGPTGI